jgi:hypothetical protein
MTTVQPRVPMNAERIWSEEEKAEWLAANGSAPTHVVTFEPLYQIELCIPPWEQPDRQIARSAVTWGKGMSRVFDEETFGSASVVAAHHEGNSLEVYAAVTPKPRLHRLT